MIDISYLKYCEVLEDAVHHVLLGKMFEFENKVDHVFTHWGPVEFVNKPAAFKPGILRLNFFHHLFAEAANFCRALNCHILRALITGKKKVFFMKKSFKSLCDLRCGYAVKSTCIL